MKDITLVQEYRVTHTNKDTWDDFADYLANLTEVRARGYADTVKENLGVDHVELIKTQVFELDRSESAEERKQREIRELTERLLKLVSE